jgi:hypothetical protein
LREHGSGALDHQPAPPNDSGIPLRHSHAFFWEEAMIMIKEQPKKMTNMELLMIVLTILITIAILFVPYR